MRLSGKQRLNLYHVVKVCLLVKIVIKAVSDVHEVLHVLEVLLRQSSVVFRLVLVGIM